MSELDEKLAAARERRAAALAAREAATADAAAARELADIEQLEKLEDEYGPEGEGVAKVWARSMTVFVKRPHPNTYGKFAERDKPSLQHVKEFVWPCIVPVESKPAVEAAIAAEPHLLLRLANVVSELAGAGEAARRGK